MAPVGQTVVAQRRATRGQRGPYVWVGAQSVGGIRHLTPYKLGGNGAQAVPGASQSAGGLSPSVPPPGTPLSAVS